MRAFCEYATGLLRNAGSLTILTDSKAALAIQFPDPIYRYKCQALKMEHFSRIWPTEVAQNGFLKSGNQMQELSVSVILFTDFE